MGKKYSPDIRDAILERYRAGEPVTTISSSTGIARSTIYTWINQSIAVSRRTEVSLYDYKLWYKQRREELRIEIKKIYDDSNQIFGAKKICAILKERGHSITKEMVAELMRDQGLCSIRQDAKDLYKKDKRQLKNTLNQQFDTSRPDEVWVSDVTCFRTNGKSPLSIAPIDISYRSRKQLSFGNLLQSSPAIRRYPIILEGKHPI